MHLKSIYFFDIYIFNVDIQIFSEFLNESKLNFFHTKETSFNFSFNSNELHTWEGFQGFVTSESISKFKCPLSDKTKPFKIENETQIYYLRSSYSSFDLWPISKVECAWRFLAPEGYIFKIDVLNTTSKILVVSNQTRDFITRCVIVFLFAQILFEKQILLLFLLLFFGGHSFCIKVISVINLSTNLYLFTLIFMLKGNKNV